MIDLILAVLLLGGVFFLVRWQKKQSKEGALLGYNKELGVSTIYDVTKDANAVQAGTKAFKPNINSFLVPAIVMFALGGLAFFESDIYGGAFLCFLGGLLLLAALGIYFNVQPTKNKSIIYTVLFAYFAVVGSFLFFVVFPGLLQGRGLSGFIFFLLFSVGGSFYSYYRGRKTDSVANTDTPAPTLEK